MRNTDGSVALIAALMTAQWFSSAAAGFVPAAGNAVYLAILLSGGALCAACLILSRWLPRRGLEEVCAEGSGLRWLALGGTVCFALLAAAALRDTLSMLRLTLLPQTPRWFALAIVLPALLLMGRGTEQVKRTIRLLAPLIVVLYGAVLAVSLWGQGNGYNLFPLLGTGGKGIGKAAVMGLPAGIWLAALWIDGSGDGRGWRGAKACLWSTGLAAAGYLCYALLYGGNAEAAAFPLHRMSLSGGLSYAFERAQAVFVFAWLPVQLAASAAGLAYAVKCTRCALPKVSAMPALLILLVVAAGLALPDPEHSPAWLTTLMQSNVQGIFLLPLLAALIAGRHRARHSAAKPQR